MPGDIGSPEIIAFETKHAWEAWLRKNQTKTEGVWIRFAKKKSGIPSVTYDEALEVALCYGWIDGQGKGLDEKFHIQRWTPRRAKSMWSKRNRERVTELIEAGKMKPPGLREIERARADGRWDAAYDSPSTATVPEDLAKAFKRNAKARRFFETLDSSNRYAILHRLQTAKKPETRARRLAEFVEMLSDGRKIH